jgi:hypothetical protein
VRIVDQVVNVDMNQSPHPKNSRGELGKPLFNWYNNTVSKDPLTRVTAPNHFADQYLRQLRKTAGGLRDVNTAQAGDPVENLA